MTVQEQFVERFNVPLFVNVVPQINRVKEYQYQNVRGKTISSAQSFRKARSRKGERLVEIQKQTREIIQVNSQRVFERHYLRFPEFFNRWMIDNALFEMLQYAPDFEQLRLCIDGGGINEIYGEKTDYGEVYLSKTLIAAEKPYHRKWGEVVYIDLPKTYL